MVGAGVFGAWTAWHLRRAGQRVLLLDASGPANARASSGGESRMTRTIYGADDVYTQMAWDSLEDWRWLSSRAGLPVFHPTGVLMFFGKREPFVDQSLEAHRRLGLRLDVLGRAELQRRYPQIAWDGVEVGLFEPDLGALMARRAVQTLVQEFVAAGGEYRLAAVAASRRRRVARRRAHDAAARRCARSVTCSPAARGCRRSSRRCSATRIFPTRQEVFFFAPEAGDERFEPAPAAGLGGLQRRRHLLRHSRTWRPAASRSRTTGTAPRFDPDTGDRQADGSRPGGRPRLPGSALSRARRAAARRVARLPIREQLERRPR